MSRVGGAVPEIIDISHYQRVTSWAAVKNAGIEGVIAKATESSSFVDPLFLSHMRAAHGQGLPVGAYHFARPDTSLGDAVREADHFLRVISSVDLELRPVLDLEAESLPYQALDDWVLTWCDRVADGAGVDPMIYTGNWFVNASLEPNKDLVRYGLWIAHWTSALKPTIPKPWTEHVLWQYGGAPVPGILGNVDRDRCATLEPLFANPGQGLLAPKPPPPKEDPMRVFVSPIVNPAGQFRHYLANGPAVGDEPQNWREISAADGFVLAATGVPVTDLSDFPLEWERLTSATGALGVPTPLPPP
jgi:lysozyme